MAAQEYITAAELTYAPIKRVIKLSSDTTIMDDYIARANNYYEDLAQQLNVAVADIVTPIPVMSTELLNYYVTWKYAAEHKGMSQTSITTEDVYSIMEQDAYNYYKDYLHYMTPEYISGTVTDRSQRSVSFGKVYRS
jgi:hypothetical protein